MGEAAARGRGWTEASRRRVSEAVSQSLAFIYPMGKGERFKQGRSEVW